MAKHRGGRAAGNKRWTKQRAEHVHAMFDALGLDSSRRAVPCSICGYLMAPSSQGAHTSCLDQLPDVASG